MTTRHKTTTKALAADRPNPNAVMAKPKRVAPKVAFCNVDKPAHPKKEPTKQKAHKSKEVLSQRGIPTREGHNSMTQKTQKSLDSYSLAQTTADLIGWAHTVQNPRTKDPRPAPRIAAPGQSGAEAIMRSLPMYGQAVVNAEGFFAIGVNGDGWHAQEVGAGASPWYVNPDNQYLQGPGGAAGYPVHYTIEAWAGSGGGASPIGYPAGNLVVSGASVTGLRGVQIPGDFSSGLDAETGRYMNVGIELRLQPTGVADTEAGQIGIFNYATTPLDQYSPTAFTGPGVDAFASVEGVKEMYINRQIEAAANWPSDHWLEAVAIPNTLTCFGQWLPLQVQSHLVGSPSVWAMGTGMTPGTPIAFQVTMVYALYGVVDYTVAAAMAPSTVGPERLLGTATKMGANLRPVTVRSSADPNAKPKPKVGGVASVLQAEADNNNAPKTKSGVVSALKTAKDVVEVASGESLGDVLGEIAGAVAAFLF